MDEQTSTPSPPPATAQSTPTPESPAPQGVPTATAPAATTPPEDAEGGAGDEEGIRVPVELTVTAQGIEPSSVAVPAFLPLEIRGISGDGQAHLVTVAGETLAVPPGGSESLELEGQQKGTLPIEVDGTRRGEVVVGAEPGP
ncbi:MAG: hypothetical protein JHC95_11630 [Solirubrobacteraceae bacterium]|nr:hypothetical protein [Solirubrobacteraceae bacterium]